MSAIVQDRICRATGTRVQIIDARIDPDFEEYEGGRWVTWCCQHETLCQHETRHLATWHAADPTTWCGLCAEGLA